VASVFTTTNGSMLTANTCDELLTQKTQDLGRNDMTISRLRTPILLVGAFVLAFGAALWALAATGGTDSVRAASDDAEVSGEDKGAHGKEDCSERKGQMLDRLVENGTITEDQKASVLSLMEQVKDGGITHEEFKTALEDAEIDIPRSGKGGFRGHRGGHSAPSADETVVTTAL